MEKTMEPTNYTVRLWRKAAKGENDNVVAEIEIEGSESGPAATASHYAHFAKLFMSHIRFDYATAEPI